MTRDQKIGAKAREIRKTLGMTQAEVCQQAAEHGHSLHDSDLSRAEGGEFGWVRLQAVAAGLRVPVSKLVSAGDHDA